MENIPYYSEIRLKAIFSSLLITENCHYPEGETALASLKKERVVIAIKGKIAFNRISIIRIPLYLDLDLDFGNLGRKWAR